MNRFWRVAQLVERGTVNAQVVGSIPTAPAINRRRVLAGLLASPLIVPAVKHFLPPVGGWPLSRYVYETKALGFTIGRQYADELAKSLYPIQREALDGVALVSRAHPFPAEALRAALLPGLQKIWAQEYSKYEDDWINIFSAEEQLTLFDELDPNSLEEIEIECKPAADTFGRISLLPEKERVATADATRELESDRERNSGLLLPRLFGFGKGPAR